MQGEELLKQDLHKLHQGPRSPDTLVSEDWTRAVAKRHRVYPRNFVIANLWLEQLVSWISRLRIWYRGLCSISAYRGDAWK